LNVLLPTENPSGQNRGNCGKVTAEIGTAVREAGEQAAFDIGGMESIRN
jgi:hypothetical protein